MILNDLAIQARAEHGMIQPFVPHQVTSNDRGKVVSFGLTSFGYDIRLGQTFVEYQPGHAPNDPKTPSALQHTTYTADHFVIKPGAFVLAHSAEHFNIPADIVGVCVGKSTYARLGIHVLVTPLEPGWRGYLTLEIANLSNVPVKLYAGEGIAQIMFHEGDVPLVTYGDRGGKYQDQAPTVVLPRMK
jgi:dCTP deaminase